MPIKGGTYWIVNCGMAGTNAVWCAVDGEEKIVAISADGVSGADSCNCKAVIPDTATKLYWIVTQPKSIVVMDRDVFEIIPGDETIVSTADITTSNATISSANIKFNGVPCISVNASTSGYIELPTPSGRHINIGVWVRASSTEAAKITSILATDIDGSTSYNSAYAVSDKLKMEDWAFLNISSVTHSASTKIKISPSFATGQTSVEFLVCPVIISDSFSKPYAVINFDHA